MSKPLRIVIHVLLFLAALAVFWVGIVFGLTVNPNLGTTLWIVAIAIAGTERAVDCAVCKESEGHLIGHIL